MPLDRRALELALVEQVSVVAQAGKAVNPEGSGHWKRRARHMGEIARQNALITLLEDSYVEELRPQFEEGAAPMERDDSLDD